MGGGDRAGPHFERRQLLCGRLYFDTQRHVACQETMAARSVWFLVLAGLGLLMLTWVLAATGRARLMVAGVLGAIAVAGGARRLRPAPPAHSADLLLRERAQPSWTIRGAREDRFEAIHSSMKRAATAAFGVSGLAGLGAGAVLKGSRRGSLRDPAPKRDHTCCANRPALRPSTRRLLRWRERDDMTHGKLLV